MKTRSKFFRFIDQFIARIEKRVPLIPDFNDLGNIWRLMWMGPILCIIYTFLRIDSTFFFFEAFSHNVKIFTPFFITNMLGLIGLAKVINKQNAFRATLLIFFINFVSVYATYSIIFDSFIAAFSSPERFVIYYIGSFSICFFFLMYFDWRERTLAPANTLAKLSFLQSKMRPHFLFNTINSAVSMVKSNPDQARKMLLNLSELIRASLKEERIGELVSLETEVSLAIKYLEIEQIRLGDRLTIDSIVDDDSLDFYLPKFILQPLIENAIIHGIAGLPSGGKLEIRIKKSLKGCLIIEIKNPIYLASLEAAKQDKKGHQITVKNLEERLRIYYEGDAIFKHEKLGNEFYVYLEIPEISNNIIL